MTQNPSPESTPAARHYREEVLETLNIGKDTYYKRIKFLNIEPYRDEDKRTYLDDEQLNAMVALDSHIKETGKMEGFPHLNKSEGSGALVRPEENGNAIAPNGQNAELAQNVQEVYVGSSETAEQFDMAALIRGAQELAAQNMSMSELVKLSLAQQIAFDDLPDDLKEKVKAARLAADPENPKRQPAAIASELLAKWRSGRSGK